MNPLISLKYVWKQQSMTLQRRGNIDSFCIEIDVAKTAQVTTGQLAKELSKAIAKDESLVFQILR
jgi:hypothetical protein